MDVYFKEIERPKTRATRHELSGYDLELEWAIRHTASTKKAIVVSLGEFHSSPAKSRLWGQGFSVRHRRDGNLVTVWADYVGLSLRRSAQVA